MQHKKNEACAASDSRQFVIQAASELGHSEDKSAKAIDSFVAKGVAPEWLLQAFWAELPRVAEDQFLRAPLIGMLADEGVLFPRNRGLEGYVVSLRLPPDIPAGAGDVWQNAETAFSVKREVRFPMPFAPPGFVERLVSRLHDLGDVQHYWQDGTVCECRIDEGSGVFRFVKLTAWMIEQGFSEATAEKYGNALSSKAINIKCAEELTWYVKDGRPLPAEMRRIDEEVVRDAMWDQEDASDKNAEGDQGSDDLESWLTDVANIHVKHAEAYASRCKSQGISTIDALREFVAKENRMPCEMTGMSHADLIESRIKDRNMSEIQGEACLRVEYSNEELVISSRGTNKVLSHGLVAVAQYRMFELQDEFKGLNLGENKYSDTDAHDALLLRLAIQSEKLPKRLIDALPAGSEWRKSVKEDKFSKRWRDVYSRILTVDGRALLALESKDQMMADFLKLAGLKENDCKTLMGSLLESRGRTFWALATQQLMDTSVVIKKRSLSPGSPDQSLLKYDFMSTLGKGGFGVVYKLMSRASNKEFAFKDQRPPSKAELIDLERETTLQQKASHGEEGCRFVVQCFDPFEIGLRFCFFIECCPNGELGKWLDQEVKAGTLSSYHLWKVLGHMLDGLVHLHSLFIMHRGKCSN